MGLQASKPVKERPGSRKSYATWLLKPETEEWEEETSSQPPWALERPKYPHHGRRHCRGICSTQRSFRGRSVPRLMSPQLAVHPHIFRSNRECGILMV